MATSQAPTSTENHLSCPNPSCIKFVKKYFLQETIQQCIKGYEANEELIRLQGVTWIDGVRKSLHLPVYTYNTAVMSYLKYRLIHPDDNRFIYIVAAALYVACKIEETKKNKTDILAAAHSFKLPEAEQLMPYNARFETHPNILDGLEHLMYEASGFNFRTRHPQLLVLKLAKSHHVHKETVGKTAYYMCLDVFRTFAPLKQAPSTLAVACVELSARLFQQNVEELEAGMGYKEFRITRAEVMETLFDLLDLYTQHQRATIVGREHNTNTFLGIRIILNLEASTNRYPRYNQSRREYAASSDEQHLLDPLRLARRSVPNSSENRAQETQCQQSVAFSNTRIRYPRSGQGTVRHLFDATRVRDEKRAIADFFRPTEVQRPVERSIGRTRERGWERDFERDGERKWERGGERKGTRTRDSAGNSSPSCPRDNFDKEMGSKSYEVTVVGEDFEQDWREEDSAETFFQGQPSLEGAHRRIEQRKPWEDPRQAYHNAKGIPNLQIQNQIANIRKRYAKNSAETEPQVEPHGPKKARLSSNSQMEDRQTESGRTQPKKKET